MARARMARALLPCGPEPLRQLRMLRERREVDGRPSTLISIVRVAVLGDQPLTDVTAALLRYEHERRLVLSECDTVRSFFIDPGKDVLQSDLQLALQGRF